ncbi:hypothetical protein HMPREF1040_0217 [Megasphaera sp. UPII 135-E]|nr:hypothetical protein HMPREF1040_0217 [Megasphaera sp. UPII 135-E]
MIKSGSFIARSTVSIVIYAPCCRILGITSCVIQRLNSFASGFRLESTRLYSPYSFTIDFSGFPGIPSFKMTLFFSSLSSLDNACLELLISKQSHTSLATNHGSPFCLITRTLPKVLLVNIFNSFISKPPFYIDFVQIALRNFRSKKIVIIFPIA